MKVEHIGLRLIVPHGRLVVQLHYVVHVLEEKREEDQLSALECGWLTYLHLPQIQYALLLGISRADLYALIILSHAWQYHSHVAGSLEAKYIGVLPLKRERG